MRGKQIALPGFEKEFQASHFGGAGKSGNPRDARPIAIKRSMHLVLKSSKATGSRSFLAPKRARDILLLIHKTARANGIRLHRYANGGNHLHLIIQTPSRKAFHKFLRSITGLIARMTTGRERGAALSGSGGHDQAVERVPFWDARPFTRILEWGRDFNSTKSYVIQNTLEALGFTSYSLRRKHPRPG